MRTIVLQLESTKPVRGSSSSYRRYEKQVAFSADFDHGNSC